MGAIRRGWRRGVAQPIRRPHSSRSDQSGAAAYSRGDFLRLRLEDRSSREECRCRGVAKRQRQTRLLVGITLRALEPLEHWILARSARQSANDHDGAIVSKFTHARLRGCFRRVAVRSGARIFARPMWQIWTQVLTAAVMIFFAAKLAFRLFG
jgi:hypothetical protein